MGALIAIGAGIAALTGVGAGVGAFDAGDRAGFVLGPMADLGFGFTFNSVPITLGVIDYRTRTVTIADTFRPTGDADADMAAIKAYYRSTGAEGRRPHLFSEYKHANPKD